MRGARTLLLVCLAVGLGALWYGARAHQRELRASLERSELRALRADLRERGRRLAAELEDRVTTAPVLARYDLGGRLVRPARPGEAVAFRPPQGTLTDLYLRKGQLDRAQQHAETSTERAAVLLRRGDARSLGAALAEDAVRGTELAYRIRLELFRLARAAPDADWRDDVSALLGGPSDRFAKALLREADVQPVLDPETRRTLASLTPRPGFGREDGRLRHTVRVNGRLVVRELSLLGVDLGAGPVRVALPAPLSFLAVRGRLDEGAVETRLKEERLKLAGAYLLAGLILVIGTIYAYVAIGRSFRLTRAKSDFVANVTHELKTPLANIRLFAESLRADRVRTPDRREFLDALLEETRRLDTLVEGLLHAAHGARLRLESLDAGALVSDAEARWRPRLEGEGFAFSVQARALPNVRGDKEALQRALDNLLDNARKYSVDDRRIELDGTSSNGAVRLCVRDHGPGIPASDRERMLRPFTRMESADRKETQGTGLGLSLVVACMEAHGGRLEVGAAPGEGAAVTMILPVAGGP